MKKDYTTPSTAHSRLFVCMNDMMPLIYERLEQGKSVKLSPKGISMLPMLRQGKDSVVLSPVDRPLKKYDVVLYRRANGQYVLHRIVAVKSGSYTVCGDNQTAYERGVTDSQLIAVVTSFSRAQRKKSIDSLSYRAYCFAVQHTRIFRRLWRGLCRRVKRLFGIADTH